MKKLFLLVFLLPLIASAQKVVLKKGVKLKSHIAEYKMGLVDFVYDTEDETYFARTRLASRINPSK